MSDYSMLGSLSTGGAKNLNGDLITKLKDAETKSKIDPLTKSLELWDTEKEKIGTINTKVNELIAAVKQFDLFNSGKNVFDKVTASSSGDAAIFDASDVGALKEGTMNVKITQIAQKDVYQSAVFTSKTVPISGGQDTGDKVRINGIDFTTVGKSYDDLAKDINLSGTINASVEQVSDSQFRLVIKSKEPGEVLNITETGVSTGLTDTTDADGNGVADNHILVAQNLKATVDGVAYDVSADHITIDGNLKITGTKVGDASISIKKDDSSIIPAVKEVATKYNELLALITEEVNSSNASVKDKSSLKSIVNGIKEMMFKGYGSEDKSLFNYGFSFDKLGLLTIDEKALGKALTDNVEDVKKIFVGTAESKGFGTALKEHLDDLNAYNGLFSTYKTSMDARKKSLEEDKEKEVKSLDTKYSTMAKQFSDYGAMITKMESAFGGLKMMISQSQKSS